jgi:hypothetical protein
MMGVRIGNFLRVPHIIAADELHAIRFGVPPQEASSIRTRPHIHDRQE